MNACHPRVRWLLSLLLALGTLTTVGLTHGVLATTTPQVRVRLLNAVPDSAGVDVVIDLVQVANNAPFKTLTSYVTASEGNYALSVYPTGKRAPSLAYVYKRAYFFHAPKDYTIVVHGTQADNTVDATVEIDRNALDGSNNAQVRFGNDIPDSGALTVGTAGTNTVLGTANFAETADYTDIAGGTYTLVLYDGNGGIVTKMDGVTLGANTTVSVFALGRTSGTPGPELLVNADSGTASPGSSSPTPAQTTTTTAAPSPAANPAAVAPAPSAITGSAALRQALQPVPAIANTDTKVFFAATGHTLGGSFKAYWDSHGGLAQFGFPISEEYQEVSLTDGKTYTTQYFERARFEYHPENKGTPYEVLQGLLGSEMLKLLGVS